MKNYFNVLVSVMFMIMLFFISNSSASILFNSQTELGAMISGGNSSYLSLIEKGDYNLTFDEFHKTNYYNTFIFNKQKDKELLDKMNIGITYSPLFLKFIYPTFGIDIYRSNYKEIIYRTSLIAGISFNYFVNLGIYYDFEIQKYKNLNKDYWHQLMITTSNDINFDIGYIMLSGKFIKNIKYSDYRIILDPSISFYITKLIDFKTTLIFDYEKYLSKSNLKHYDYILLQSLVLKL
jgi:hypothetical protein